LPLLLLALALPATSGCTQEQREAITSRSKAHKRQLETTQLRDRAMEYWEAVRWGNWQEASNFLLEAGDQKEFLRAHASGGESRATMDQIEIQYAFVDAETGQSAELRIGWNVVVPTLARVEPQVTTQHWLKKHGRWWITSAAGAAEAALPDEDDEPEEPAPAAEPEEPAPAAEPEEPAPAAEPAGEDAS